MNVQVTLAYLLNKCAPQSVLLSSFSVWFSDHIQSLCLCGSFNWNAPEAQWISSQSGVEQKCSWNSVNFITIRCWSEMLLKLS